MTKSRGFTMVELLVVIAIIGTLVGIGYPVTRSLISRSQEAACLGNLRSLGVALQGYLQEHNDTMPSLQMARASSTLDVAVLDTALLPYLQSPDAFHCPADKLEFEKTGSSYSWNPTQSGRHISNLYFFGVREDTIPLITDKESWHPGGTNFLFADLSSSNKPRFAVSN
ncbi:MAG: prepilin-type N-terminal cleavage/methylation domain-containing protein [Armatimonadetes bacterium]|nr:prepilin-type N-terminal cleavage/methylation domain-containing protein [Akkermansiaceae bacterium]